MNDAQKKLDNVVKDWDKAHLDFDTFQADFYSAQIQIKELNEKLPSQEVLFNKEKKKHEQVIKELRASFGVQDQCNA